MPDKIMHIHLKDVCLDEDNPMRITTRLYADVVDMTDNLIVDACVKEARRAGVNDVYLLDRQFVLDALREKIQGTQREKFLLDKIKQLEAERDAAVDDIHLAYTSYVGACQTCKHVKDQVDCDNPFGCGHCGEEKCKCNSCDNDYSNWEWRGVQKED